MTEDELKAHKKENPSSRKKNIEDGFAEGGETYIRHKRQELKRGRSLSLDPGGRAISWGDLMEQRVYDLIGLEYHITSKETTLHPKIPHWSGSTDLIVPGEKIGEIKCYQPEKSCDYGDILLAQDIDRFRSDKPEEYWQIVSNAAIHQVPRGEAISYLPYDREAKEIAEMAEYYDGHDSHRFEYIWREILADDLHKLPFQPNDSGYPNLISWEFVIPKDDIKYLESRIKEATKLLLDE